MGQKTILIVAANPKATEQLRLDEEVRGIEEALRGAKYRDKFAVKSKWAVRIKDLRRAMLDTEPSFVHFSGHGGEDGIVLENDAGEAQLVTANALAGFFSHFKNHVECVVLNACYSLTQAQAIVAHIPYTIGMKHPIADQAAILFATAFYDAIGACRSVDDAFGLGRNAMEMEGMVGQADIPELLRGDAQSLSDTTNGAVPTHVSVFGNGASAGERYELTVDLTVDEHHQLRRRYYHHNRFINNDLADWGALEQRLTEWRAAPAQVYQSDEFRKTLFDMLFPAPEDRRTKALFQDESPLYRATRLRIHTNNPLLAELPWHLATCQNQSLVENEWTFELIPDPPSLTKAAPHFTLHFNPPCSILLVAPYSADVSMWKAHCRDLEDELREAWGPILD